MTKQLRLALASAIELMPCQLCGTDDERVEPFEGRELCSPCIIATSWDDQRFRRASNLVTAS